MIRKAYCQEGDNMQGLGKKIQAERIEKAGAMYKEFKILANWKYIKMLSGKVASRYLL